MVKWGSRLINIDIIFFGDLEINHPDLTIPHPYFRERDFVMHPILELKRKSSCENIKKNKLKLFRRQKKLAEKISLYGFNNLTKSLSFNIYDICYAASKREKDNYLAYIDEQYNSERLTSILLKVTSMIGAHVLNISKQDYEPQGASVNLLIADDELDPDLVDKSNNLGIVNGNNLIHAHLDKSHLTVHTFPETHPNKDISTFRVDIDVATCGKVSPLSALNYLISQFESDILTLDYRVRGFTRDQDGKKLFIDHEIASIQDYIAEETLDAYDATDINVYQANLYHTKMKIKDVNLPSYLFSKVDKILSDEKKSAIYRSLQKEIIEIYSGMNIYG